MFRIKDRTVSLPGNQDYGIGRLQPVIDIPQYFGFSRRFLKIILYLTKNIT